MKHNGKYIHIDQVLESIRARTGFEEVYQDECKEWVWEAIGVLGVSSILEDRTAEISIEDHRGLLPNDLYLFDSESGIREKESNRSLIPTTDIFFDQNKEATTLTQGIIAAETYNVTYDELGDDLVSQIDDSTVNLDIIYAPGYVYEAEAYTYRIQGSYIFCGIETTTLQVTYKGFPIWDDYTPKIPDDPKYIKYVTSYLMDIIVTRMWLNDRISRDKKDELERDYLFNAASARSHMLIPDKDEMENISRMRMRLLPKPAQFDTGFRYLNAREKLRKM